LGKHSLSLIVLFTLLLSGCLGVSSSESGKKTFVDTSFANSTLTAITVTPSSAMVAKTFVAQFSATGTYSDGSSADLTSQVVWSSDNTGTATITADTGSAIGVASGSAVITATAKGITSNSANLTVTASELTAISITPASATVAKSSTTSFAATGTFSDGSQADITKRVTWATGNSLIASINSATGVAKGVAVGETTIVASSNGITSPVAKLAVNTYTLSGLNITPATASTPQGQTTTFTATATYADGSTGNVSGSVAWASSEVGVATINTSGIASTLAQGSTNIKASINGITSNSAALTVTAPVVTAIKVSPTTAIVAKGHTTSFTATATYSDGATSDITNQVTWASGSSIVTINKSTGVATAATVGNTVVSASLNGVTSPTASIAVTTAALQSISITPATTTTPKGLAATFSATGTYSDGTTGNVSGSVTWASSNTAVATLNTSGVAATLAIGSTTITATTGGVTSNAATLTVTTPVFTSLAITPSAASIVAGITKQLIVSGKNTDGSIASLGALTWTSSNTAVATVDSGGLVTTLSAGTTDISATSGSIVSNNAVFTVSPMPAPIGVFAVSGINQVTVTWSPVSGAASYNIYWGTMPGITTASSKITGSTSPHIQTGLTTGSTYYYRVGVVNGDSESLSNEVFSYIYTGGNPAGNFTATGSMALGRAAHTATLLSDGKVLVVGGATGSQYTSQLNTTSAELYDPATGAFTATIGTLNIGRREHSATLLTNGKVLIAGGASGSYATSGAEIYDPLTGSFSPTGSMVVGRRQHSSTLLPSGKVLLAGGYSSGGPESSSEIFDPETGKFTTTGSMAAERQNLTATLLSDGRVLVTGFPYSGRPSEIYSAETGAFSPTGSMLDLRFYGQCATLLPSGNVLVAGGISYDANGSGGVPLSQSELLDPQMGTFSATGSMISARSYPKCALLPNGKVLVIQGLGGEIYDTTTGSFSAISGSGISYGYSDSTVTVLPNGKVLVTGGGNFLSSAELFQ